MRIVVVSPPRSGNHWLECLLGRMYRLKIVGGAVKPDETRPQVYREWAQAGGFPDQSIFHLHCRFRPKLCDAIEATPAQLVSIIRDPYDAFVSLYYWTQHRPMTESKAKRRPRHQMVGKELDDPEVLAFLADDQGFGSHLQTANEWLRSGRSIVVRYEELHRDPVAALTRVAEAIGPVPGKRIVAAINACSADRMRQRPGMPERTVRAAVVGDSRQRLTEAHLAIFRDRYADVIRSLGYEVR